jgi:hypothetical protein
MVWAFRSVGTDLHELEVLVFTTQITPGSPIAT